MFIIIFLSKRPRGSHTSTHFQLKSVRFNKNLHGINKFMTRGLLISRITKIKLLKQSVKNPNIVSSEAYRKYRNIFNSVLRASKKLYYKDQLKNNSKNPRKIWDLINPLTTKMKSAPIFVKLLQLVPRGTLSSELFEFLRYLYLFKSYTKFSFSNFFNSVHLFENVFSRKWQCL